MERTVMNELVSWKNRKDRKPLILYGARQVGKTFILKEFGRRHYDNVAYINCDNNEQAAGLFESDYNMQRIILSIGAITGERIMKGSTLIILDEIQELPRGLASLKYFCEDAPEYHVAVAGSLLGIMLHEGDSFPVGKVNIITLYPMSYEEFLLAKGREQMVELLINCEWDVVRGLKTLYIQTLREYYFVGGMPEVVKKFIESNDAEQVRDVQNEILLAYDHDISKHAPAEQVMRINQVWHSIPSQLAKENKKFVYGVIKKGARAKEYELAIQWLLNAGLVYKINRLTVADMPLRAHEDISAFKLYMMDCGLLGAMNAIPPALLLLSNTANTAKGDFTENFICCQMKTISSLIFGYYSKNNSLLELDFVLQEGLDVIPVEVKAEENLQSKSLKTFLSSHPNMKGLRFSMSDFRTQDKITNVPLYGAKAFLERQMKNR